MQNAPIPWEETVEWTRIVAGCVIYKAGKYLLVQERQERAYGLWNLPAGHVDKGETIEEAAVREALEETGYTVELREKVGVYHEEVKKPIKHAYYAEVTGGKKISSSDEILQVKWLTYSEIEDLYTKGKIRAEWIWAAIRDATASRS